MTSESVKIVQALYEAFERRDGETPFAFYSPDIVWDRTRGMLGGIYHGHDGIRESFRDLLAAFSTMDLKAEEVIAGAGDRVFASVDERYIGRGSGVEVNRRHYAVWTVSNGMVTRMVVYLDRGQALKAAGLGQ